nr:MAG TPA: hypothetical protein [Bacteriophage sp.]
MLSGANLIDINVDTFTWLQSVIGHFLPCIVFIQCRIHPEVVSVNKPLAIHPDKFTALISNAIMRLIRTPTQKSAKQLTANIVKIVAGKLPTRILLAENNHDGKVFRQLLKPFVAGIIDSLCILIQTNNISHRQIVLRNGRIKITRNRSGNLSEYRALSLNLLNNGCKFHFAKIPFREASSPFITIPITSS